MKQQATYQQAIFAMLKDGKEFMFRVYKILKKTQFRSNQPTQDTGKTEAGIEK